MSKNVTVETVKEAYNNLDEGQKSDFWYRTNQIYKEHAVMKTGLLLGAIAGLVYVGVKKAKKAINKRKQKM